MHGPMYIKKIKVTGELNEAVYINAINRSSANKAENYYKTTAYTGCPRRKGQYSGRS